MQLAPRREFMIQTLQYILNKKRYFHRLESDLARNNIHFNNKRKPELTNKNTGKTTFKYRQPV